MESGKCLLPNILDYPRISILHVPRNISWNYWNLPTTCGIHGTRVNFVLACLASYLRCKHETKMLFFSIFIFHKFHHSLSLSLDLHSIVATLYTTVPTRCMDDTYFVYICSINNFSYVKMQWLVKYRIHKTYITWILVNRAGFRLILC